MKILLLALSVVFSSNQTSFAQTPDDSNFLHKNSYRAFELTTHGELRDSTIELYILAPSERREMKVSVIDGELRDSRGQELSYGKYLYVLSCDGDFYLLPYGFTSPRMTVGGAIHHSSVLGRRVPTCGAGNAVIEKGKLVHLDRDSGHFLPDTTGLLQAFSFLDEAGLNVDTIEIIDGVPTAPRIPSYTLSVDLARAGVKFLAELRTGRLSPRELLDQMVQLDRIDSRLFRELVEHELKRLATPGLSDAQFDAYLKYLAVWPNLRSDGYFLIKGLMGRRVTRSLVRSFLDQLLPQFEESGAEATLLRILADEFITYYDRTAHVRAAFSFTRWLFEEKEGQMQRRVMAALTPKQVASLTRIHGEIKTPKGRFFTCLDYLLGV